MLPAGSAGSLRLQRPLKSVSLLPSLNQLSSASVLCLLITVRPLRGLYILCLPRSPARPPILIFFLQTFPDLQACAKENECKCAPAARWTKAGQRGAGGGLLEAASLCKPCRVGCKAC